MRPARPFSKRVIAMQIEQMIGREIAAAMNENRDTAEAAMLDFFQTTGETAGANKFSVRNFNSNQVLIEGEGVTEQAATFLRGAGFDVLHSGNVAIAKTNSKRRMNSRGGANVEKVSELRFFNDDKSIRDARKMYQNLVEAKDWRFFAQFLKDMDNVISNARMREGHDADDENNDGSTAESTQARAPILKNDKSDRAVAGAEPEVVPAAPEQEATAAQA